MSVGQVEDWWVWGDQGGTLLIRRGWNGLERVKICGDGENKVACVGMSDNRTTRETRNRPWHRSHRLKCAPAFKKGGGYLHD